MLIQTQIFTNAVELGYFEVCKILIDNLENTNPTYHTHQRTSDNFFQMNQQTKTTSPLKEAARNGHIEIYKGLFTNYVIQTGEWGHKIIIFALRGGPRPALHNIQGT